MSKLVWVQPAGEIPGATPPVVGVQQHDGMRFVGWFFLYMRLLSKRFEGHLFAAVKPVIRQQSSRLERGDLRAVTGTGIE